MPNRGFTLLEIVLAIGLSGAVIALLTTAIDLYLVRVDSSRSQVETAQLARTLLNLIADDIRAARYGAADSSSSGSSDSDSDSTTLSTSAVRGVFGTSIELRVDRSAVLQWEQLARQSNIETADVEAPLGARPEDMPQTVQYLLGDGRELLTADFAGQGVSDQPIADGYAGLYRQQLPTAAWIEQNSTIGPAGTASVAAEMELIAPEVVAIEFYYFDGVDLLTEWDSELTEGLPKAIEIRLTLLKEPWAQDDAAEISSLNDLRSRKENLVEFRRFVLLTRTESLDDAGSSQAGDAEEGAGGR